MQVRDYRKLVPEQGSGPILTDGSPIVKRVRLRMSLENVVKDIPLMTDCSWTYGDLMVRAFQFLLQLCNYKYGNSCPYPYLIAGSGVSDIESLAAASELKS